jgi:calcineurin-like phosphoesterase family protein
MRLILISDTHGSQPAVPDGDVLIHAGDFACGDTFTSLRSDIRWLQSLPHRHKILVPGNHDLILLHQKDPQTLLGSIHYLVDRGVTIDGVTFHGLAWKTPVLIPSGVDVLVSHMPPRGILDAGRGCPTLRRAVALSQPRVHVFGHIHEAHGEIEMGRTRFYNAARFRVATI